MATIKPRGHWRYSKSAIRNCSVPKPVGFEDWFYTGPSWHFGHFPPKKSGKKR